MGEEHRQRKKQIIVRLLDEEKVVLEEKAHEAGMSQAEYIRNMILFGAAHERTVFTKEDARNIRYELNRIGNNINQIAYNSNSKRSVDDAEFAQLEKMYHDLLAAFENSIRGKFDGLY